MERLLHYSRLLMIVCLITSLFSCERLSELYRMSDATGTKVVQGSDDNGNEKPGNPCGEPVIIPLVSRDNQDFSPGNVIVSNDEEFLTVKFEVIEGDWQFDMIYLQVGPLDLIPLDDAGTYPAFWEFDHKYDDIPIASYTFQISLASLDDCFKILAQARVVDGENIAVLWTKGENPGWTQGPFYTYYCIENCKEICDGCKMGVYRTQTPGGWGAKVAGNNPGSYRDANFTGAFPDGLVVGIDDDETKYFKITLTSSPAIEKLLPTGGKPASLTKSYMDPDPKEIKNVLVGHIVALSLSIGFDVYDEDFGEAEGHLRYLIIADGHGFNGMSVAAILDEANIVLSGGASSYSPSQMTEILTKINEYFVDGKKSEKYKLFDCK